MVFTRFFLLAILVITANASADDFQSFRIPSHRVGSLSAAFDGWYSARLYRPIGAREETSEWSGQAAGDLFLLSESDRFLSQVQLRADLDGRTNHFESRRSTGDTSQTLAHDNLKQVMEALNGSWQGRAYPWTFPLGVQLSLDGNAYWSQNWESQTWTDRYPASQYASMTEDENWTYHYSARISGMAGWGRVRDASGIYQARVMEQRLRESGVITGELQPETIQRLAQVIYRRNDFGYAHERSDRFYWREIGETLRSDPAFHADRFDAYNIYLAGDPFFPSTYHYRPRGYFFGPTIQFTHGNDIYRYARLRTDSNGDTLEHSAGHPVSHYDQVLAGVSASYYRPIGMKWQLDAISTFLTPVRPGDDQHNRFSWNTQASLSYVITDRWWAAVDVHHRRSDLKHDAIDGRPSTKENSWSFVAGGQVAYYVEDHWSIYAHMDYYARGWRDRLNSADASGEERDTYVRVGLAHFFFGAGYPQFSY